VRDAFHHLIGLVFAVVFCRIGRSTAQNPGNAYRVLSFGQSPEVKSFADLLRAVGWCFAVAFGLGAILYLVLIPVDILR
jgi:hypothetical protein